MSEVRLVKFVFKEDGEKTWLDWCQELKRRENEVQETLENEGVYSESCFLSENEKCIYYFMEVENIEKARAANRSSNLKIDTEHREYRLNTLKKSEELKQLFHFSNKKVK